MKIKDCQMWDIVQDDIGAKVLVLGFNNIGYRELIDLETEAIESLSSDTYVTRLGSLKPKIGEFLVLDTSKILTDHRSYVIDLRYSDLEISVKTRGVSPSVKNTLRRMREILRDVIVGWDCMLVEESLHHSKHIFGDKLTTCATCFFKRYKK